jgi:hypothetical protein
MLTYFMLKIFMLLDSEPNKKCVPILIFFL